MPEAVADSAPAPPVAAAPHGASPIDASGAGAAPRPSRPPGRWSRVVIAILVAAIAIAAGITIEKAMEHGPGLSTDSVQYLYAARSLAGGDGLEMLPMQGRRVPMTHFPPLYPTLLAAASFTTGQDVSEVARWLNVVLLPANLLLIMVLVRRCGASSRAAVVAGVLALACPAMFRSHLMLWSEPLFLALTLGGLLALARGIETGNGRWLCGGSLLFGLAAATRYAGAAGVVLVPIAVAWWGPPTWTRGRRMFEALATGATAALPPAACAVRNWVVGGTATNRSLVWHPLMELHWQQASSTITEWMFPTAMPWGPRVGAFGAIVAAAAVTIFVLRRRNRAVRGPEPVADGAASHSRAPIVFRALLLYAVLYAALLLFTLAFVDAYMPLDDRILLPLYPAALAVAFRAARRIGDGFGGGRPWRALGFACSAAVLVPHTLESRQHYEVSREHGLGYARQAWMGSRVGRRLERAYAKVPVFTNSQAAIYVRTGRVVRPLPIPRGRTTGRANPNYDAELRAVRDELVQHRGVVVILRRFAARGRVTEAYFREALGLELVFEDVNAAIYRVKGTGPAASAPAGPETDLEE